MLSDRALAQFRNRNIGFVFQQFNLLPRYTALANVELPMLYGGISSAERRRRASAALERVGLGDRMHHQPSELSGGQQQRVSIARAIVQNPVLLLADEPTGALDTETTEQIMDLFRDLHRSGMTIVIVTHEPDVAAYCRPHHPLQGRAHHLRRAHRAPAAGSAAGGPESRRRRPGAVELRTGVLRRLLRGLLRRLFLALVRLYYPRRRCWASSTCRPSRGAGAGHRQPSQRAAGSAGAGAGGGAAGALPGQEHLLQASARAAGHELLRRHPGLPHAGLPAADAGDRNSRNEASFESSRQALAGGQWLALFPEGTSHSDPQLRPLKTGAARIALSAAAASASGGRRPLPLQIVPVGLAYESKAIFRSAVQLVIGRPLSPGPHLAAWQRDERAAVEALTGEIRQALDAVVLQAETTDLLAGIAQVAAWTADDPAGRRRSRASASSGRASCWPAYQRMRDRDPARVERIVQAARDYARWLQHLGVQRSLGARGATGDDAARCCCRWPSWP